MSSFNFYQFYLLRRVYRKLWRKVIIVLLLICVILLILFEKNRFYSNKNYSSDVQTKFINVRHLLSTNETKNETKGQNFPEDLFTKDERRSGAVIFHIIGMIYMFVALAIVCDEFFIQSLDVITEKMDISEDIAGATFMAAGGSAPELFTSVIGVFISNDDVGIGTIVGSAVFNILFVISMCAIFSKSVLELTWWPLFRDVSFYSVILISLMLCFLDNRIHWYEAFLMLLWYVAYVTFMKYNETFERIIKRGLNRAKLNKTEPIDAYASKMNRKMSTPILHGGSKFRQGVLQLMIHSIDPLHEESINNSSLSNRSELGSHQHTHPPGATTCTLCSEDDTSKSANGNNIFHTTKLAVQQNNSSGSHRQNGMPSLQKEKTLEEEKDEPLNISWPTNLRKQLTYVILAPIIIPLWLTLPDVRRPEKRKWFAGSFIGSIIWIAIYSYLMVWWATLVGDTFDIPSEIMGITFLAAGTSIPDLITSVLVARKGFGDMAVSSSVGSNIFDVTVGLPFPWFLHTIIIGTVSVTSKGMICSILLLFIMLLFVILTIAIFKWKLNVGMAIVMFMLYFVFIACSLILEKKVIKCSSIIPFF